MNSGKTGPNIWNRLLAAAALLLLSAAAQAKNLAVAELPEDLGPAVIDVSDYPAEHQKAYKELFLPVYELLRGGPARAINSPLLEIDGAGENALRRTQPELFQDPRLLTATRDGWKKEVFRVKNRPPCCGACPVLTQKQAQQLWRFLVYDALRRKTGPAAASWLSHRKMLVDRFEKQKAGSAVVASSGRP